MMPCDKSGSRISPHALAVPGELCSAARSRNTLVLTKRILTRWVRDLVTVIEALVFPILFLLVLKIVIGNLIYAVTHDNPLYSIVPLIALGAAITGSTFVAIDLMRERSSGLLSRLWVMPVHRASGLLSRIVADAVRILFTTVVMLSVGIILGFRFRAGCDREPHVA